MSTLTELVRVLSLEGMLVVSVLELQEMEKFYSNQKQCEWIDTYRSGAAGSRNYKIIEKNNLN